MNWNVLSLEYPVANSHSVYMYNILVILTNFNNNASLVPFGWRVASLVLYAYVISNLKRGEFSCVFFPTFSQLHQPVPECLPMFLGQPVCLAKWGVACTGQEELVLSL